MNIQVNQTANRVLLVNRGSIIHSLSLVKRCRHKLVLERKYVSNRDKLKYRTEAITYTGLFILRQAGGNLMN